MSQHPPISELERFATQCRIDIIEMISAAGNGHPGSSLSAIDLIVSVYKYGMKWDLKDPLALHRDRFVLSKGHAVPAIYAVLAQLGLLEREELKTFRQVNSRLQGHPDRVRLPFMEASTGSLGQGLSIAQGLALGFKSMGSANKVFCLIGDGESQEGQIWEAAMSAPKFGLNNLILILDNNRGQIDGFVEEVMDINPVADKWRAFNWKVIQVDGHNFGQILNAMDEAQNERLKPTLIWANTVKGKGVSFMENQIKWHGVAPNMEETALALSELKGRL